MSEFQKFNESEKLTKDEILAARQNEILSNWERKGIPLTAERFKLLLPSITHDNLKERPEYKHHGMPPGVFAVVNKRGEMIADTEKFFNLNEQQQRHSLAHETSHRLDWLLRASGNEKYQDILNRVSSLPTEQVSYYVDWLDKNVEESEEKQTRLSYEKMADTFAQYLNSDGNFGSMIRNKLLQFPGNTPTEGIWEKYNESAEMMEKIDRLESMNNEERTQFFTENPQIQSHYELFTSIDSLMKNSEEMGQIFELLTNDDQSLEDWELDMLEYEMMVQEMPASMPMGSIPKEQRQPLPSTDRSKEHTITVHDLIDPFGLFRSRAA